MDAIASLPASKTPKLSTRHDVGQGKDIISNLPDEICHHIISFLPIKDVLRTSLLSKRWQYLSIFISSIEFDDDPLYFSKNDQNLEVGDSFLDSVDRALDLDDYSYLRKFRLYLDMPVCASRVYLWVSTVILHKVHELDLSLPTRTQFVMPRSLFTSESLSILKLEFSCTLMVPPSIHFSSLKMLHLSLVTFHCEQSTQKFFSGFPVLEDLVLYNCSWRNIRSITISFPTLRTLTIDYDPFHPLHLLNCEIKLYALNLISFKCTSFLIFELVLCDVSALVDAYIDVLGFRAQPVTTRRAVKLLSGIYNVKLLTLSNCTLESISFAENLQDLLPTYYSLTYLHVELGCSDYTDRALMHFLQKSPNLESLNIPEGFDPETFFIEKERIWNFVPHCFKSCLKTFCISNFNGDAAEIHLLEYLLENAIILDKMTIFCLENLSKDLEKLVKISHQLQLVRRGLTSCVIEFL